jgi:iron complex outermembrane receptor protein
MRITAVAAALCVSIVCIAERPAVAGAVRLPTNIPTQPLIGALEAFERQRNIQLIFVSEDVRNVRTLGASGEMTSDEAMKQILSGTGLSYRFLDEKTVTVFPLPSGKSSRQPAKEASETASVLQRLRLSQANESSPSKEEGQGGGREPASAKQSELDELQASAKGIPEVLVTGKGSLNMDIRRSRDDAQPYVIYEREKIERSGAVNLESFLRDRLAMNANGLPNGARVSSLGAGSSFNLRGLGANQTLILVDGHRLVSGMSTGTLPQQGDINSIPVAAVERIEVLPATASGIYGGGATGGVINIILRRDYNGVEAKATYGNTFESDVASRRIEVGAGLRFEEGRTNLLFLGSYADENSLRLSERSNLMSRYYSIVQANDPALLLPPNSPPLGTRPNIRSADGSDLVLDNGLVSLNSPVTHIPTGYLGNTSDLLANAGQYDLGLADSAQIRSGAGLQISQAPRVGSFRTTLRREFSEKVDAFLEASAARTNTFGPIAVITGSELSPYSVAASAPTNPFTTDILVTVPTTAGSAALATETFERRLLGGVIVELPAEWQAEMDYTWSMQRYRLEGGSGGTSGGEFTEVLNGGIDVLRDTTIDPVDFSAYDISPPLSMEQDVAFRYATLRLAGPTLNLPAGPIRIASLLEYRKEITDDARNEFFGLTALYPARRSSVSSFYVEAQIPLVSPRNRRRGFESLEVQLAGRADEYRTVGQTGFVIEGFDTPIVTARNETRSVNPMVAIRYRPLQDLTLRVSYGTGFVPPDASQLAPAVTPTVITVTDPKRGNTVATLPIGSQLQGGNPDLEPEESKSLSMGLVLTPRILPDLRLSLDYTRIRKTDNIATYPTGRQGIVNDEDLLPGRIVRGPNQPGDPAGWAGPIVLLNSTLFNVAEAEVEAFDLQLDYSFSTGFGTFSLTTVASAQPHYETRSLPGQPTLENVGYGFDRPQKFTGNAELRWQHAAWTAGWVARYYHSYVTENPAIAGPATEAAIRLQGNGGVVPSQTYHDMYVAWRPGEVFQQGLLSGTEVQLGLRNVFDEMPPFDASIFAIYGYHHSPLGNALGRSYQISLAKRF